MSGMKRDVEAHLLPMEQLGRHFRRLRERAGKSQLEAGTELAALSSNTPLSWQSMIARIERGKEINPKHLPLFAEVYKEPLKRLVGAYVAANIFGTSPKAVPGDSDDAFFISNAVEIYSIAEMATWEAGLRDRYPAHQRIELWIVSPTFIDGDDQRFLGIVAGLLCDCVDITYFLDKRDLEADQKFDRFLDRVTARLKSLCAPAPASTTPWTSLGNITAYGLSNDDLAWFTCSLVIANPDDIHAGLADVSGYMVVPIEGMHSMSIPIEHRELLGLVSRIKHQVEKIEDGRLEGRTYRNDALRNHAKFKKEFGNV